MSTTSATFVPCYRNPLRPEELAAARALAAGSSDVAVARVLYPTFDSHRPVTQDRLLGDARRFIRSV